MYKATIGEFTIEVFNDLYAAYSTDNINAYDLMYIGGIEDASSTIIGIKVYKSDSCFKSAIIVSNAPGTAVCDNSCIFKSDRVIICCSDFVFCLSMPDLSLIWKTKCDTVVFLEIFRYKDDYIVHGELEITRLNMDGKIAWQQTGEDIFTTLNSSKDDFIVTADYILATDWNLRKYTIDFLGNIL